jgi:molybdate transport system substrate-binding protein
VRKGAAKPDVSTAEAFKNALLGTASVTFSEGPSGAYFLRLLDRLGIAEGMKPKLRPGAPGAVVEPVARGEVEMAVAGIVVILGEPGVDLAGWLPAELQAYVPFTAGVGAKAEQSEAARSLVKFLTSPATVSLLRSKGLESVTP